MPNKSNSWCEMVLHTVAVQLYNLHVIFCCSRCFNNEKPQTSVELIAESSINRQNSVDVLITGLRKINYKCIFVQIGERIKNFLESFRVKARVKFEIQKLVEFL
jgi:hypothetical protein